MCGNGLTLIGSLTQVVGPAVPGLVLVGESGVEGRSAVVVKFALNVFGHVSSCVLTAPETDDQYRWKKMGRLQKAH